MAELPTELKDSPGQAPIGVKDRTSPIERISSVLAGLRRKSSTPGPEDGPLPKVIGEVPPVAWEAASSQLVPPHEKPNHRQARKAAVRPHRPPSQEYRLAQAAKAETREIAGMPFESLKALVAIKLKTLLNNGSPPVRIDEADKDTYDAIVDLFQEARRKGDLRGLALLARETLGRSQVNDKIWASLVDLDIGEFVQRCQDEEPQTDKVTYHLELEPSDKILDLDDSLPWCEGAAQQVTLKIGSTQSGNKFYVGEAIRGKRLERAQSSLSAQHRINVDNMFSSRIQGFVDGSGVRVGRLVGAITSEPIYYFGNDGGQRAYFMTLNRPDIDAAPIVIRVANCDKNTQMSVLKTITSNDTKQIKKFSKL